MTSLAPVLDRIDADLDAALDRLSRAAHDPLGAIVRAHGMTERITPPLER